MSYADLWRCAPQTQKIDGSPTRMDTIAAAVGVVLPWFDIYAYIRVVWDPYILLVGTELGLHDSSELLGLCSPSLDCSQFTKVPVYLCFFLFCLGRLYEDTKLLRKNRLRRTPNYINDTMWVRSHQASSCLTSHLPTKKIKQQLKKTKTSMITDHPCKPAILVGMFFIVFS